MIKLSRKVKWWCVVSEGGCRLISQEGIVKDVVRLEIQVAWVEWQQTAHLQGKQQGWRTF